MKCGRQPGGSKVDELGICPAAVKENFDGINKGKNAGRLCWLVAGTLCKGEVQGTFAAKFLNCQRCPFYLEVEEQEGRFFILRPNGA